MRMQRTRCRAAWLLAGSALLLGAGAPAASAEQTARVTGAFGAYLAGRSAAQSHDLAVAADELERAVREDPGAPELTNQAFLVSLLAGQSRSVALAATLPNNPLAQLVLADRDAKAGRWEAAQTIYAALPRQDMVTQVLQPLLIAWAQQGQGRTDEALATLGALSAGPRQGGVYSLHAAMIADVAGRTDAASRLYPVAASEYGGTNLRLALILASWRARHGDLDGARRAIDELGSIESDLLMTRSALETRMSQPAVRGPADGIAEAYLVLAATFRPQNSELAQIMVQLALDMRPDLTAARILLADIEVSEKQPQAALATLHAISADDPLTSIVALRQASLLDETGDTAAAETLLARLAEAHPDRPEPFTQQGDILRRKRRFEEAARAYSAAIGRLGTPNRADWPLFYARGITLERSGQWSLAEQDLRYALQLAPDQPSILNYLAYSWAERGEHLDEARQMLEQAIAARPNDGAIIDSLGWVLLRQNETGAALTQLQRAAELEPEDPVVNLHLGDALAAAGRMREAEFQWRRALILKPDEEDAKKLNEKLASLRDVAPPTPPAPGSR